VLVLDELAAFIQSVPPPFSPTDRLPLTVWAKTLMSVQSIASLITVSLVAACAVNIL